MSVTLSELSLRNAKRQARDYLVYFVTVVMAAALLYSFNGLVFSQEIITLSTRREYPEFHGRIRAVPVFPGAAH